MTEIEFRNRFVHAFGEYYGCEEGDNDYFDLVNLYNQIEPLPRGYALKPGDSWCAASVSAVAQKLGITDIVYPECSVQRMKELYKANGRYHKRGSRTPMPGDLIVYDWNDNDFADHVGVVVRVVDGVIRTMEGNMGHRLGYRDIKLGDNRIDGYLVPDFANKCGEEPVPKFSDVNYDKDWFADSVDYVSEHGLMSGIGDGLFAPKRQVTRAELAAVIANVCRSIEEGTR